ncbi:metallophosphoesterase MPPED2-like [Mytilus trossulus]|uniref:metallophosphoesterase MPPED2-like n=1 Tax=Mytilus trossulus TaxID=6551 RepID=UPI00300430F3
MITKCTDNDNSQYFFIFVEKFKSKKMRKLGLRSTTSKKNEREIKDFLDDEKSEKYRQVNILPDLETDMPSRAWRRMSETQTFKTVAPLNIHSPVQPDCLRFVCLSDTHSMLHADNMSNFYVPPGDILLHAGDFTNEGRPLEIERFNEVLGKLPHKKKIVIAGNHELSFDESLFTEANCFGESIGTVKHYLKTKGFKSVREILTNAIYLQDAMVTVCGINIYGSPWQPRFGCWAFNVIRGKEILQNWNYIPDNVDILITHGPPVGYGLTTDGETLFINASSCTKGYKLCNPPIIFDVPLPHGLSKYSSLESVEVVSYSKKESSSKPVIGISQKTKITNY